MDKINSQDTEIYTTFDSFEADQVAATLEYYGIPSYKKVEGSGQYIGIIMGHMTRRYAYCPNLIQSNISRLTWIWMSWI